MKNKILKDIVISILIFLGVYFLLMGFAELFRELWTNKKIYPIYLILFCLLVVYYLYLGIHKKEKQQPFLMRILMLSLAIVSLVIFYSSLMELFYIGFPDGMTTELGLMQKKTYQVYIIITGLFALFFIYSNIHKTVHPKIIKWAVVLFVVFVISMYFIGVFLSNTYDNIYGVEAY